MAYPVDPKEGPILQANEGGKGGDPIKARKIRVRSIIEGELAAATRAYLNSRFENLDSIDDSDIKAQLRDLQTRNVLRDINREKYKPQDTPCIDEDGNPQPATAIK